MFMQRATTEGEAAEDWVSLIWRVMQWSAMV